MPRWYCCTCGIVRDSDERPWCRHYALELPAARMEPISPAHPFADGPLPEHFKDSRKDSV